MKPIAKSIYILLVAIVVFTGALLIVEGAKQPPQEAAEAAVPEAAEDAVRGLPIDNQEGSAI